ncbi:MAG: hypothetical protein ACLUVY_05410 [Bacteroides uniformis]
MPTWTPSFNRKVCSIHEVCLRTNGARRVISHGELLQPELSFRLKLSEGRGTIQDLTADEESLYLFHDTGEIVCYDVKNGKQQYDIAAYPRTEQRSSKAPPHTQRKKRVLSTAQRL